MPCLLVFVHVTLNVNIPTINKFRTFWREEPQKYGTGKNHEVFKFKLDLNGGYSHN